MRFVWLRNFFCIVLLCYLLIVAIQCPIIFKNLDLLSLLLVLSVFWELRSKIVLTMLDHSPYWLKWRSVLFWLLMYLCLHYNFLVILCTTLRREARILLTKHTISAALCIKVIVFSYFFSIFHLPYNPTGWIPILDGLLESSGQQIEDWLLTRFLDNSFYNYFCIISDLLNCKQQANSCCRKQKSYAKVCMDLHGA